LTLPRPYPHDATQRAVLYRTHLNFNG